MNKREEIQMQAVNAIIKNKFHGIVDVAPRVGKTKLAIDALKTIMNKKILVIAPFNPILDSWKLELKKWYKNYKDIDIINQRSLSNIDINSYDLIVADECHTLSELQLMILKLSEKPILGLTGSLGNNSKKILKLNLMLKPIFTYSIEEAITDKIISNYKLNIHYVNLDNIKSNVEYGTIKKPLKGTEAEAYKWFTGQFERFKVLGYGNAGMENIKYLYAGKRATLLYTSKSKFNKAKELITKSKICLVFTTRTTIADKLCPNSYHSKSEEDSLEDFAKGTTKKLAVCNMVSMGVTIKGLKHIIGHQIQSSEEMAIQKFLRAMNFEGEETALIELVVVKDTQDEIWVDKAISFVPQEKITRFYE